MDVIKAIETYVTKLVSEPAAMKVLLLDTHTVSVLPSMQVRYHDPGIDSDSVSCIDPVYASVTSSISHR